MAFSTTVGYHSEFTVNIEYHTNCSTPIDECVYYCNCSIKQINETVHGNCSPNLTNECVNHCNCSKKPITGSVYRGNSSTIKPINECVYPCNCSTKAMNGSAYHGNSSTKPMNGGAYHGNSSTIKPINECVYHCNCSKKPTVNGRAYHGNCSTKPMNGSAYHGNSSTKPMNRGAYHGNSSTKPMNGSAYHGNSSTKPMNGSAYHGNSSTKPIIERVTAKFSYPFDKIDLYFDRYDNYSTIQYATDLESSTSNSTSEFFVFVGVTSFLYCIVAVIYYVCFANHDCTGFDIVVSPIQKLIAFHNVHH